MTSSAAEKTGRNDPCPCGSGKKYKQCCRQDGGVAEHAVTLETFVDKAIEVALEEHQAGRLSEAEALYRKILDVMPDCADALHLLGAIAHQRGNYEDAVALFKKAIAANPIAPMHANLGLALHALRRFDEAVESYEKALALAPDFPQAHNNLGNSLQAQGKFDLAFQCYQRALSLDPHYADAHYNLGHLHQHQGRFSAAVESYTTARALNPGHAGIHNNLGNTLYFMGQLDAAAASLRHAIAIDPHCAEAFSNLGNVFQAEGNTEQACVQYRHALMLKPDSDNAHSSMIFALDLAHDADTAILQQERVRWNAAHAAPLVRLQQAHTNRVDPARRLRIGYISADLRWHSAAVVFGPMLVAFDHAQFDVFVYSNTKNEDAHTELFRQNVSAWRRIVGLSDELVTDLIRRDEIDILVDLSGFSSGNRLLVFARKPAPVQVTAWGYATSTGMQAMDAFFADAVVVPPNERALYVEDVRYLPNIVGSFYPRPYPDVNTLPALSAGYITFGSCNRLCKVSEQAFHAWAQVLLAVPNSRMILKSGELDGQDSRDRVAGYFTREGIDPARLTLLGNTSWDQHVATSNQIDIGLDPFPHAGGVTTLECMMMGVPVVTLRWPTIAGRLSASILTTLGLTDWIAETPEEYVRLALQKAGDIAALASLRQQLRGIFKQSVIGDPKAYATAVEAEYRLLWQEWCGRQSVEKLR